MTLYVHVVDSSSLVKGTLIKITHLNKGLMEAQNNVLA